MFLLVIISLVVGILVGRYTVKQEYENRLSSRNLEWAQFIASYKKIIKPSDQLLLINKILSDIAQQGLVDKTEIEDLIGTDYEIISEQYAQSDQNYVDENQNISNTNDELLQDNTYSNNVSNTESKNQIDLELDNASLLLYFGAFLFVTSVGLFIAFSSVGGFLKVVSLLILSLLLYGLGCYLYTNKKNYYQVGIAFAGIGMTIMPLVGFAVYKYVFLETSAPYAWFIGSVLSLIIYAHAVWFFRKPFINYILIFTAVSLFESSVSIISLPLYYFGWSAALFSILLLFISKTKNIWPDFRESAVSSSQVLMPLTIFGAFYVVHYNGLTQLGVSLLIGSLYYWLLSLYKDIEDDLKSPYAFVSHIIFIFGLSILVYGISESIYITALAIFVVNFVQLLVGLLCNIPDYYKNYYCVITVISLMYGFILAYTLNNILYFAGIILVIGAYLLWLKQKDIYLYIYGSVLVWLVPIFILVRNNANEHEIAYVALFSLFVQALIKLLWQLKYQDYNFNKISNIILICTSALTALLGLILNDYWAMFVPYAVALLYALVGKYNQNNNWYIYCAVFASTPVIVLFGNSTLITPASIIALLINIFCAVLYRNEINRILGAILWFILPVTLATGVFEGDFTPFWYMVSYLIVMFGFILARSIARGVIAFSGKVALSSYDSNASLGYVIGYILSAIVSVIISVYINQSYYTTIILIIIAITNALLAIYIEKRKELLAFLPFFAQAILLSILKTQFNNDQSVLIYNILSTSLGLLGIGIVSLIEKSGDWLDKLKQSAILCLYISPIVVLTGISVWTMPVGLMFALLATFMYLPNPSQSTKEVFGFFGLASLYWLLAELGINNIQIYSHLLVALLALYAYLRYKLSQKDQYMLYLYMSLATATIPLSIQAMAGQSGGLYGWWLLLEQVTIMLIGVVIKNSILIKWGLYVSVIAVLWQLRGLEWVALSLLALFIIAIAIYKIQSSNKSS